MCFPCRCLSRRSVLTGALSIAAGIASPGRAWATQPPAFARWVATFKQRALKRGISEQTYDRVMGAVTPDTSVYVENSAQPEFTELIWQYINRRCSTGA